MTPYAGNPDSFPSPVDIPSDADPPAAATFNVANEGNLDRTASLANGYQAELANTAALKAVDTTSLPDGAVRFVTGLGRYKLDKTIGPTDAEDLPLVVAPTTGTGRWFAQDAAARLQYKRAFTANGTWVCPRNLVRALCELWGGGGGGGAGQGTSSASSDCAGGPGGGAGQRVFQVFEFTPTTGYAITIGAGGFAGSGGNPGGGGGGDGGVSSIGVVVFANGGAGSLTAFIVGTTPILRPGGARGNAGSAASPVFSGITGLTAWPVHIGDGGYASNGVANGAPGGASELIVGSGGYGTAGTTSTNKGGSGGGGGGFGPGGGAGQGGNGGNGTGGAAGAPQAGGAGASPVANTGGGGGGGGGAGASATGTAPGGNGGAGATGMVTIRGYL